MSTPGANAKRAAMKVLDNYRWHVSATVNSTKMREDVPIFPDAGSGAVSILLLYPIPRSRPRPFPDSVIAKYCRMDSGIAS